jgi:hypothetical protein
MLCVWAYTDYDPSLVASCCGKSWYNFENRNDFSPLHSTTTGHRGRVITRKRPYTNHCSVAYKAPTTPWRWQPFAETCRGRIWNVLIKIHYVLVGHFTTIDFLLFIYEHYSKRRGAHSLRHLTAQNFSTELGIRLSFVKTSVFRGRRVEPPTPPPPGTPMLHTYFALNFLFHWYAIYRHVVGVECTANLKSRS